MFSKREAFLLAAAAMTVVATLTVLLWGLTLDDAYITFRYAPGGVSAGDGSPPRPSLAG